MHSDVTRLTEPFLADADKALATGYTALLVGSAARGEYVAGRSDVNLLLILPNADPATLRSLQPAFDRWRAADDALSARIDEYLASQRGSPLAIAAVVAAAVTPHTTLVVGSSNVVRDLDVMAVPWPPHEHRFVVGNRGLAGIDGTVSTAIGIALGREGASCTIAYLGDLTLLHDTNGLLIGPDEPRPDVTFVVLNDDGGAIFAGLEQGAPPYAPAFERVFGTPHRTDLAALCRAHGIAHERITQPERLAAALGSQHSGIRLIEVPVSRAERRRLHALRDARVGRARRVERRPLARGRPAARAAGGTGARGADPATDRTGAEPAGGALAGPVTRNVTPM